MPSNEYLQARHLYQEGRLPQAVSLLTRALAKNGEDSHALELLGAIRFQMGQAEEGRRLVERAIQADASNAEAWNSLGLIRHLTGSEESALDAFSRATEIDPRNGGAWMNRGFVLQELGRHVEAIPFFEKSLAVGFKSPMVHFFLGNAYAALGQQARALGCFDIVVEAQSGYADAWNNRGNALLALGRTEEGVASFQQAATLAPKHLLAQVNLATALHRLGQSNDALLKLDGAARLASSAPEPLRAKADILIDLDRLDEAAATLRKALANAPHVTGTKASLMRVLQHQGWWRESLDLAADSSVPSLQVLQAVTLPVILESGETIAEARRHLETSVEGLRKTEYRLVDPLKEVGLTTFFLAYHGVGERKLQSEVAEMYRQLCPGLRFECGHTPSKSGRIRVGVLSAFLHAHTIGKLFSGLFERLDRERFEVVYLQLGRTDDVTRHLASAVGKHVVLATSLFDSIEQVAGEELDILLFPDVGMDHQTYFLAFARLAPVQCVMWGHPMTTGSPAMDHFISSHHLERPDGEAEYTERLARLPSLTTYFSRPPVSAAATKADYGLPGDARLYACLQTLFKFHPDFDRVLAAILEQDDKGRLVLIEPKHRHWRELLEARWRRDHPVIAERAIFLPGMNLDRFLGLCALSDAVLDPIQFGGGNSSLECFAVGAPVVTLPQGLLRNRITYAAYKQIGFEDLIADDEADYVALAHRLATDEVWRQDMRRQVYDLSTPLFESTAAVEELSGFLESNRP